MAISRQWTEWHLTPGGWVSGSSRRDGEGNVWRDEPEDRVVTFVYQEQIDKTHPEPHRHRAGILAIQGCRGSEQHRSTNRQAWPMSEKALKRSCGSFPFRRAPNLKRAKYLEGYAVVLLHSSFIARVSSWAIIGAVAVSMAERCIR